MRKKEGRRGKSRVQHVEGWEAKTLRQLATINYGKSPTHVLAEDGLYPVVGTGGSDRLGNNYLYEGESVILGRKGTIERVYFATGRFWTIDTAYYLSDFCGSVPRWLYYALQCIDLRQMNEATGVPSLSRDRLYMLQIPTPPKPEQVKITEILSTVDRAIEHTEALIAKQQRIKTGLMQDLLTRGIDERGNLRSEQTHQFKNSPLGRIPVEWVEMALYEVYAEVPRNGIFKTSKEIGMGSAMIGQTCFTSDRRIDYALCRRATVSKSELTSYELQEDDILVTRVYATVDGVGLPVLVEAVPEPAVYESNMLRLRVDTGQVLPIYVFYWLMSAPVRRLIMASVNASNQTSVNQQVINLVPIALPKKSEQETIAFGNFVSKRRVSCKTYSRARSASQPCLATRRLQVCDSGQDLQ
jgi:restriction endonuclease S subunit